MNQVHCNECHKPFPVKPHEKKHGKGIIETFFTCPHCQRHYTSFVTNAEIRKRQREIRKLTDSLPTILEKQD